MSQAPNTGHPPGAEIATAINSERLQSARLEVAPSPPPRSDGLIPFPPSTSRDAINGNNFDETAPPPRQQQEAFLIRLIREITRRHLENLSNTRIRVARYGRFTPLFGGRLVLGIRKRCFIRVILLYAMLIGNTVFMQGPLEKHCGGFPVYVTGIVLGALTLCTFVIFGVADPGVVPKNYSSSELLAETEDYRARHPDKRYFKYCRQCMANRPPRTFHCSTCGICIRKSSLHMQAAGTCVGERNRRSYFFHVMFQNAYATYLIATSGIITIHITQGSAATTRELIQMIASGLAGLSFLFCLTHGSIFTFIFEIYLIVVGRTRTEYFRKYFSYDRNDCVVDKLPVCVNVRNFFCQKSMPSAFRHRLDLTNSEVGQVEMPDTWSSNVPIEQTVPPRETPDIPAGWWIQTQNLQNDITNANVQLSRIGPEI